MNATHILLYGLPIELFEYILKNLSSNDIVILEKTSKVICQKVSNSFYRVLQRKIKDLTVYDDKLLKEAWKYKSLAYLSMSVDIGIQNDNDTLLIGENYVIGCPMEKQEDILPRLENMDSIVLSDSRIKSFSFGITALINTTNLFIGNNLLEGEIPESIGNLCNLSHLNLSNNKLTGGIPESFVNLRNITHLYIFF
jgi:Leucine-rich repeat (LRR) protein